MAKSIKYVIAGYTGCSFHDAATRLGRTLARKNNSVQVEVITKSRKEYLSSLENWKKDLGPRAVNHQTSPFVWKETAGEKEYIGGSDSFSEYVGKNYSSDLSQHLSSRSSL